MSAIDVLDQAREAGARELRAIGQLAPGQREAIARAIEAASVTALELAMRQAVPAN